MKELFDSTGPSLSESEIGKFEEIIRLKFPQDFRSFLLESNGGVVREGFRRYCLNNGVRLLSDQSIEFYIDEFLSIDDYIKSHSNILGVISAYGFRIPSVLSLN